MKILAATRLRLIADDDPNGDKQRIKDLQMDIQHLEEDVKDMEENDEDASRERKQLEDRRLELRKLKGLE